MTIKIATTFFCVFFFLLSCKRNGGTDAGGNSTKLKWYIDNVTNGWPAGTDSFSVSYDNQNRLIALTSPNIRFAYAYTSSNTFTYDDYENGQLSIHEIAYVNDANLVDSNFQLDYNGDTVTEKFTYNGSLLMRHNSYAYILGVPTPFSQDDYTYDNDGNRTKDVYSDGNGHISGISTYTYTDKPLNIRIDPTYYPLLSKYLPAVCTVTGASGNQSQTITYSYDFDSQGRLIRETATFSTGAIDTKTYVYE